ncbi:MAG: hypothetical protein UV59_C0012G0010 [Candidatus Gottesmanbacteria bacterium GW2011_GWA1_43_11]|uniref:Uncharacterized protein n=1 Tax=Candidatus Gottesmanbacteria bacterium GW2011_GWA1_43_11 TaxID=1618436 RepID=A0A0G1CHB7_9BACT|nr:MAG: hypothetical protein UV59_C0012G0010 [Candidatus Gottesmanbacteria bacterium GW2011_GWA1_43_11]
MLSDKAMELANLALIGLVFIQVIPGQGFSGFAIVLGILTFTLLHLLAFYLMNKRGGNYK